MLTILQASRPCKWLTTLLSRKYGKETKYPKVELRSRQSGDVADLMANSLYAKSYRVKLTIYFIDICGRFADKALIIFA
jgi:hypothetical protein